MTNSTTNNCGVSDLQRHSAPGFAAPSTWTSPHRPARWLDAALPLAPTCNLISRCIVTMEIQLVHNVHIIIHDIVCIAYQCTISCTSVVNVHVDVYRIVHTQIIMYIIIIVHEHCTYPQALSYMQLGCFLQSGQFTLRCHSKGKYTYMYMKVQKARASSTTNPSLGEVIPVPSQVHL